MAPWLEYTLSFLGGAGFAVWFFIGWELLMRRLDRRTYPNIEGRD